MDAMDDTPGGSSRGGRVRKKSAKVLENEEAEQLERRFTGPKKGKIKGKPVQMKLSPLAERSPVKLSPSGPKIEYAEGEPVIPSFVLHPEDEDEPEFQVKSDPDEADDDATVTANPLKIRISIKKEDTTPSEISLSPLEKTAGSSDLAKKSAKKRKASADQDGAKLSKVKKEPPLASSHPVQLKESPSHLTRAPELLAVLSTAPTPSESTSAASIDSVSSHLEIKDESFDEDEEDDIDNGPDDFDENTNESEASGPVYANTDAAAMKVKTQAEKKASKIKKTTIKATPSSSKQMHHSSDKLKKRRPTAYTMWCSFYRNRVVASNPGIDFASISRRLGEIWQALPEKEKMVWKRKAKRLASKGSTLISTGKQPAQPKTVTTALAQGGRPQVNQRPSPAPAPTSDSDQPFLDMKAFVQASKFLAVGCTPLDAAAHLKLLGESLSIIGARLQEHKGQIAVQGSLSVLLDSLICALGPLACLTDQVPEISGLITEENKNTLDNIAYIMPGIG